MNSLLENIKNLGNKAARQDTAEEAKIFADSAHVLTVAFSVLKDLELHEKYHSSLPGEHSPGSPNIM